MAKKKRRRWRGFMRILRRETALLHFIEKVDLTVPWREAINGAGGRYQGDDSTPGSRQELPYPGPIHLSRVALRA